MITGSGAVTYLDWASTALPDEEILNSVRECESRFFGNPSSIHSHGLAARELLEESRSRIAKAIRAFPEEILFTSGGTESNNMILFSLLSRIQKTGAALNIASLATGIEHPSVYDAMNAIERFGVRVAFVNAQGTGIVDPDKIRRKLDDRTALVSVMMVNNEIGSVQRIREISGIVRDFSLSHGRKIVFHADAVQTLGKIPFAPHELGIDAASLSCHKLGGPRGVGALFVSRDIHPEFLFKGGEQENGKRPGTENTAGCLGFALACEKRINALEGNLAHAKALLARLMEGLRRIRGAVILPEIRNAGHDPDHYSPYIVKVAFPPVPGEVLVRVLDGRGIAVSTGAACSSRKQKERHRVLLNTGIPIEIAESSIRISTGYTTGEKDIDALLDALALVLPDLRRIGGSGNRG